MHVAALLIVFVTTTGTAVASHGQALTASFPDAPYLARISARLLG